MSDLKEPETLRVQKPRLQQQVREAVRRLHYSRRTEDAYIHCHFATRSHLQDSRDPTCLARTNGRFGSGAQPSPLGRHQSVKGALATTWLHNVRHIKSKILRIGESIPGWDGLASGGSSRIRSSAVRPDPGSR